MGCVLAPFAGMFPRFALVIFWVAQPERIDATFTTLWPLVGIVFLPFATLTYVLLYLPAIGVTGSDWWWVAFAALPRHQPLGAMRADGPRFPATGSCEGRVASRTGHAASLDAS
jgi:hypothetical protein